jgi:hypothetical protein
VLAGSENQTQRVWNAYWGFYTQASAVIGEVSDHTADRRASCKADKGGLVNPWSASST